MERSFDKLRYYNQGKQGAISCLGSPDNWALILYQM